MHMWLLQRQDPAQQAVLLLWQRALAQGKGTGVVRSMAMTGWDNLAPWGLLLVSVQSERLSRGMCFCFILLGLAAEAREEGWRDRATQINASSAHRRLHEFGLFPQCPLCKYSTTERWRIVFKELESHY